MPLLAQALEQLARKRLLPTAMSAEQLRRLDSDIRAMSLFSARTTEAKYLDKMAQVARDLLSGKINEATARMELKAELGQLHYGQREEHLPFDPAAGFPGDQAQGVPVATPGGMTDLSSDPRLSLILKTQVEIAENTARKLQGMDEGELYDYPAWELIRVFDVEKPRDEMPDPDEHWASRFTDAGGTLYEGRLIALKTDDVWNELGSSALFDDGLDTDVPPYWFNSGAGWRAVPRDECIRLGVIGENEGQDSEDVRLFDENDFRGVDVAGLGINDVNQLLQGLRVA